MNPKVSQRAINAQSSPLRKLIPIANETKKRGIKVYHLNIGQPDIETPSVIREAIEKFHEKSVVYAPSDGIAECKSAW